MELLRELTELQRTNGYLDEATLRKFAQHKNVPLYRIEGLVSFYPHFRRSAKPTNCIQVCRDVVCEMAACASLSDQIEADFADRDDVEIERVSCLGRCDAAPALSLNDRPLAPKTLADRDSIEQFMNDPHFQAEGQNENRSRKWKCDPYSTEDEQYGTVRALVATNDDIPSITLERLKQCGLQGMGGAGFPTGRKWELVAAEKALPKYVICNADESEPGTFKDRVILDELPHLIIEGMLLAGLTIGAESGIIYLRHEYSREQESLEAALRRARDTGILGVDAAGTGQNFDIEIFVSPGGYILGEETALLEALEDKRGEPRNKPPYPVTHGLWGKPTLINNVETFALATSIVHHGAKWWTAQGRGDFVGLKFVSVSGDVQQPAVFEVPFGTTIRELIEMAGGMQDDRPLKAFLPGGASSSFLPAEHIDTPLDFEAIKAAGSMLGTGALIVFAEGRNLFALATNLVRFFRNESCGKCVPCRIGSEKAVQLLERVQAGQADSTTLDILPELGSTLEQTSICGLGQVALNPYLSLQRHFPGEIQSASRIET